LDALLIVRGAAMNSRHLIRSLALLLLVAALTDTADAVEAVSVDSAILQLIEQVDVPARVSGLLSTVVVKEGDVVSRGMLLAQIDDAEAKLLYRRALVELELSAEQAANDIAIRSAKKALDFARSEDSRLEDMADPSKLAGLEDDPKAMARMMRQMGSEMGEEMGSEFDEVMDRLESGQSPEEIEESMPDLGNDGGMGGGDFEE